MTFNIEINIPDNLQSIAKKEGVTEEIVVGRVLSLIEDKAKLLLQGKTGVVPEYEPNTSLNDRVNPFLQ